MVWPAAPVSTTTVTRVSITEDAPVRVTPAEHPEADPHRVLVVAGHGLAGRAVAGGGRAGGLVGAHARDADHELPRARATSRACGIDVGDADVRDRRRRHGARGAPGGASSRSDARPEEHRTTVENGTLNIDSRCPDQVLGSCRVELPALGARQRADRHRDLARHRAPGGRARVGADQHRLGRRGRGRVLRLLAHGDLGLRRRRRRLGMPRRAARAALAQRRRQRDRPRRPLLDRRAVRHRHDAHRRARRGRRRGLRDPGAEHQRRRDRGSRRDDRSRSTSRRTCAPRGARCST